MCIYSIPFIPVAIVMLNDPRDTRRRTAVVNKHVVNIISCCCFCFNSKMMSKMWLYSTKPTTPVALLITTGQTTKSPNRMRETRWVNNDEQRQLLLSITDLLTKKKRLKTCKHGNVVFLWMKKVLTSINIFLCSSVFLVACKFWISTP